MKKTLKTRADTLLIVFLCICLVFFSVGTLFLSSRSRFSETENRHLTTLPSLSPTSFADGSFTEDLGDACRDGIPFRSAFLKIRGLSDLFMRGQVEGVIFGKDGYLIPSGEYESLAIAKKNISFLEELTAKAECPVTVAVVPRPIDVSGAYLPSHYEGHEGEIWNTLGERLSGDGLCLYLSTLAQNGEEIWYKTDHHWTTLGAYYAYCYLGSQLRYSPYSAEDFERETVCGDFLGSSYSLTGGIAFAKDKIELFRYVGDENYTVTADGKVRKDGLYAPEMLEKKDKYGVFLGGNYGQVTVKDTTGGQREKLLIIKDSYANSLVPFLARHFDIEMIDLRYFSGDREELYKAMENADRLLILHGADTLATTGLVI